MNQGKYIFAQLSDFLPRKAFGRIVDRYDGNKKTISLTLWESNAMYDYWSADCTKHYERPRVKSQSTSPRILPSGGGNDSYTNFLFRLLTPLIFFCSLILAWALTI